MDTRDTAEQAELRQAARRLARELSAGTVAGLDDTARSERLERAVRDAGWLELRDDGGGGAALAGGVEACIVAEALGASVADVAFTGPLLAADLARRAGREPGAPAALAYAPDLVTIAVVRDGATTDALPVVDAGRAAPATAAVLVPDGDGFRLGTVPVEAGAPDDPGGADLTRRLHTVPAGTAVTVDDAAGRLTGDDVARWSALGLALTSADLVGVMRGVLDVTVAYAAERQQYGVPIGSFQAVQHLLADAHCLMEGSLSAAIHASWAVDELEPDDAVSAGRVAKAYAARAARTVTETAVQVHGGIGNTWECIVHVYLRRALLSAQWFGDDGEQLLELERARVGAGHGLP